MEQGIEVEAWAAVEGNCAMSVEFDDDEIQFIIGQVLNGLYVRFDPAGWTKFKTLVDAVSRRMISAPPGPREFITISADAYSRQAHWRNCTHDGPDCDHELIPDAGHRTG